MLTLPSLGKILNLYDLLHQEINENREFMIKNPMETLKVSHNCVMELKPF